MLNMLIRLVKLDRYRWVACPIWSELNVGTGSCKDTEENGVQRSSVPTLMACSRLGPSRVQTTDGVRYWGPGYLVCPQTRETWVTWYRMAFGLFYFAYPPPSPPWECWDERVILSQIARGWNLGDNIITVGSSHRFYPLFKKGDIWIAQVLQSYPPFFPFVREAWGV